MIWPAQPFTEVLAKIGMAANGIARERNSRDAFDAGRDSNRVMGQYFFDMYLEPVVKWALLTPLQHFTTLDSSTPANVTDAYQGKECFLFKDHSGKGVHWILEELGQAWTGTRR